MARKPKRNHGPFVWEFTMASKKQAIVSAHTDLLLIFYLLQKQKMKKAPQNCINGEETVTENIRGYSYYVLHRM